MNSSVIFRIDPISLERQNNFVPSHWRDSIATGYILLTQWMEVFSLQLELSTNPECDF